MDEKKTDKYVEDFDLDEINASAEKAKTGASEAFDKLTFDISPNGIQNNSGDAELGGDGFVMTPSEDSDEKFKGDGFVMTPSESSGAETKGDGFIMTPTSSESEEVKASDFSMKPSSSETKTVSPEFNMAASNKEDKAESLESDFEKIDESPIKEAMDARDAALRDSVDVASGNIPRSTLSEADSEAKKQDKPKISSSVYNASSQTTAPEIKASTTVVGGESVPSSARPAERSTSYGGSTGSETTGGSYSAGNHYAKQPVKPKKEKKYVTRGTLIGCMILTMLLSTFLGSILGGGLGKTINSVSNFDDDNREERNDSKLSELNLSDATGSELTIAQIVDKNEDAVVEIIVSGTTQGMWGQMQLVEGAGSGVIIRDDGYIATNYHVIQGANKVQVTLRNGQVYPATIVGSDPSNDVAVIKIDETNLTTAEIGDSSTVDVGDLAVAIGNPLGQLGGSVTTGIISALDRTLTVEGTTLTLLQTDAAINGGNSGGGLFNAKGELIGIVESKASAVGVEGLGFALPINSVAEILNDIIASGGDVSGQSAGTPAVGIAISDVSEEQSQYYGLDEPGVYVAQVSGENAQKAGFQEQDRIVSFNGTKINNSSEFIALVRKCKVGDVVSIVVSRSGQEIEIKTELEELQLQQ